MSLKNIFLGIGKRLLRGKKESALPATGKQQKQITYTGKSQESGLELAKKEVFNPPVKLNKTKALHMGDDTAPAFGSSTYDWVMKKGTGKYTADEWLDHLTSTRKESFKIFGKPATKTVRADKSFKYDSGPFMGREARISREELFDSNLAVFNDAGDLSGGLLFAAKKFGLKLDGNTIGNMIKLNPLNRLKPVEFGTSDDVVKTIAAQLKGQSARLDTIKNKYPAGPLGDSIDNAAYYLQGIRGQPSNEGIENASAKAREYLLTVRDARNLKPEDKVQINKILGEIDANVAKLKSNRTFYQGETNYTLQGGQNYRETVFRLDEDIVSNRAARTRPGHMTEAGDNQIYHVRFDTRYTPDGKKGFLIHEIQSDVNQKIAKSLSKAQQLGGERRVNPFQADIEMNLLSNSRSRLLSQMDDAVARQDNVAVRRIGNELDDINTKIQNVFTKGGRERFDYFPMVEADQYGDHALKYLLNKAAKEGVDFVAIAPFNKVSFRQGYKAGNERFYGYPSGKGIDNKGKAVMPDLMKKVARFYGTKAGPQKFTLSDPKLPYKKVATDKFKYPDNKGGKTITSKYHEDASANPLKGYKQMFTDNPNLYFDAFAVKVGPLMKYTQKTYKSKGGLVVDIFKPVRYNRAWL